MTADLIQRIQIAVYWPGEGYGIPKTVGTMEHAKNEAAEWAKQGYSTGKSEIHIIETTKKVTKWEPPTT